MNHSFDIEHARLYGIPEAIFINHFQFWIVKNRANGTHQHDAWTLRVHPTIPGLPAPWGYRPANSFK